MENGAFSRYSRTLKKECESGQLINRHYIYFRRVDIRGVNLNKIVLIVTQATGGNSLSVKAIYFEFFIERISKIKISRFNVFFRLCIVVFALLLLYTVCMRLVYHTTYQYSQQTNQTFTSILPVHDFV